MNVINKEDILIKLNCYPNNKVFAKGILSRCIFEIISGMPSSVKYPPLLNIILTSDSLYIKSSDYNFLDSDYNNDYIFTKIPLSQTETFEVINSDNEKKIIIKSIEDTLELIPESSNSIDLAIKINNHINSTFKV